MLKTRTATVRQTMDSENWHVIPDQTPSLTRDQWPQYAPGEEGIKRRDEDSRKCIFITIFEMRTSFLGRPLSFPWFLECEKKKREEGMVCGQFYVGISSLFHSSDTCMLVSKKIHWKNALKNSPLQRSKLKITNRARMNTNLSLE